MSTPPASTPGNMPSSEAIPGRLPKLGTMPGSTKPAESAAISMTLPTPSGTTIPTTALVTKPANRGGNTYTVQKSKASKRNRFTDIKTFLNITENYIGILLRNDSSLLGEPWHELWESWIDEGILKNASLHMISVIIDLPVKEEKSNKSIAMFILSKLPVLNKYMRIFSNSRDQDPWLHSNRPVILDKNTPTDKAIGSIRPVLDTPFPTLPNVVNESAVATSNPFSALASSDDDPDASLEDIAIAIDTPAQTDDREPSIPSTPSTLSPLKNIVPPDISTVADELQEIPDATIDLDDALGTYSKAAATSTPPFIEPATINHDDLLDSVIDQVPLTDEPDLSLSSHSHIDYTLAAQKEWIKEKENFKIFMKQQYASMEANHRKMMQAQELSFTTMVNENVTRITTEFRHTSTDTAANILQSSKAQQDTLNDISSNTIDTCTALCTNLESTLDAKGETMLANVVSKMNAAELTSIAKNQSTWTNLSSNVKLTLSSLAQANSTAIKNIKVLATKLENSKTQVQQLDEQIAVQSATIQSLCTKLDSSEARLKSLNDPTSPAYAAIVDTHANRLISTAVTQYVDNASSTAGHFGKFQTTCNSIEADAIARIEALVTENCEYMQNTATDLKANIETTISRNPHLQDSKSSEPPPTTSDIPTSRNKLFPLVDPTSISSPSPMYDPSTVPHANTYNNSRHNSSSSTPLRDSEYIYNSQTISVNTNTFYKLRWNNKCSSELDIFTFYKSLQHMASTCGIPLRDLDDIDENNGVCPLTPSNCQNYNTIYKLMKGAIYYKINDATLWTGFDQGWNLVKSNLLDCDGFEVMYDILSEVLPKLNKKTPKSHKIKRPTYIECDSDNVYSYVNQYFAFLEFERLENNQRTYTAYEIAVYVADDLERDPHKRFDKGIDYVRLQLKYSADGITVPKDITITKIAKTICKYSPEYTVGEYSVASVPVIRTLHQQSSPRDIRQTRRRTPSKDMTLKCKYCGQVGHDETSESGCLVFAKWTLCQQASARLSAEAIKANTKKYFKHIKRQESSSRQRTKIEKHIRALEANTESLNATTLIHTLRALQDDTDSDSYSTDDDSDMNN